MGPSSGVWIVNKWKYTVWAHLAVPRPGHTNVSLRCPHPILLFAQETAQDLILIILAQNKNILRGLSCRKTAFGFAGIKVLNVHFVKQNKLSATIKTKSLLYTADCLVII